MRARIQCVHVQVHTIMRAYGLNDIQSIRKEIIDFVSFTRGTERERESELR